jgi:hypothetical protein
VYIALYEQLTCVPVLLQGGKNCLKGFSVQGRIEKARRNYTQMWEQIGSYRKKEGAAALSNFRLNILGEVVEYFAVPGEPCVVGATHLGL